MIFIVSEDCCWADGCYIAVGADGGGKWPVVLLLPP